MQIDWPFVRSQSAVENLKSLIQSDFVEKLSARPGPLLRWLPIFILAIPSIWMLISVPPLWRDIDGYNQVTLPPGPMTILQFSSLYCFGARIPLYAGSAWDSFIAHAAIPGWEFFSYPTLTDHGVFFLVALQHLLLLSAQAFLLRAISPTFFVQIPLALLLALNSTFYVFAHSVGAEAVALSSSLFLAGWVIRIFAAQAVPRRAWIWFGVSLTICILLRHINAVLAALLPVSYLVSGGAQTVRALFRRGTAGFPRRLVRRELLRACLAVVIAFLCLGVAFRTVRFIARAAHIHYRSAVGPIFLWRLNFLAGMEPNQRAAFLNRLASRTDDPVLKRMLLETPSAISKEGQWDAGACTQHLLRILEDSGVREGVGYQFDQYLNRLAKIFLLSFERPFLRAVWNDFLEAGRISLREVATFPIATTQYCFGRIDEMPQLKGLTTFKSDGAEQVLVREQQNKYYRWVDFRLTQALAGWVVLGGLCCVFLRGSRRRIVALSATLVCVGLALLLLTCLFTELLPRFLLPAWILLFAAALLNLGYLLETFWKEFFGLETGQVQK